MTSPIIFAIFGSNHLTENELYTYGLEPLVKEWNAYPSRLLLPSESAVSPYLYDWAETDHIPIQVFHCDWVRNGKIAQILRDDRMQKECTHALVLLGPDTPAMRKREKYAESIARKGKKVFTLTHTLILSELSCEELPVLPSSTHARKSNTGIEQWLLKGQIPKSH